MVTIKNMAAPRSSTSNNFQGYLEKKTGLLGSKKYICRIENGQMLYFREGNHNKPSSIDLSRTQTIRAGRGTTIEIVTRTKSYTFIASNVDLRDQWIAKLQEAHRYSSNRNSNLLSYIDNSSDEDDSVQCASTPQLRTVSSAGNMSIQTTQLASSNAPQSANSQTNKEKSNELASAALRKNSQDISKTDVSRSIPEHINENHESNSCGNGRLPNASMPSDSLPTVSMPKPTAITEIFTTKVSKVEETDCKVSDNVAQSLVETNPESTFDPRSVVTSVVEEPTLDVNTSTDQVAELRPSNPQSFPSVVRRKSKVASTILQRLDQSTISQRLDQIDTVESYNSGVSSTAPASIETTNIETAESTKLKSRVAEDIPTNMVTPGVEPSILSKEDFEITTAENNTLELEIDMKQGPIPSLPHAPREVSKSTAFNEMREFIRKNCKEFTTDSSSSNCFRDFGLSVAELKSLLKKFADIK